jgi:hypothetical protein
VGDWYVVETSCFRGDSEIAFAHGMIFTRGFKFELTVLAGSARRVRAVAQAFRTGTAAIIVMPDQPVESVWQCNVSTARSVG